MRKTCLLLISMLFFCLSTSFAFAEEEQSETASLNLRVYRPARILITYTYTNNFSVSDVSSVGQSLYKITSGPTSIEFKAEDIDIYTFTVTIRYAEIVGQSIQIAVWSGNQPPQGLQINVKSNIVKIRFEVTVSEQPQYPSAQEVAGQVVKQIASELAAYRRQTDETLNMLNQNMLVQWFLIVFCASATIFMLYMLMHLRRSMESA